MKSETAELLEKAEENIRAADTLIKAQFFHAEDFLLAARNYLTSSVPPANEI